MSKCPTCGHCTAKKKATTTSKFSCVQVDSGLYLITYPNGRQVKTSMPMTVKEFNTLERVKLKNNERHNTIERNASPLADVWRAYWAEFDAKAKYWAEQAVLREAAREANRSRIAC